MAVTSPEPGKWYVTFPHDTQPDYNLVGGPFPTDAAARRWHARASSLFRGGFVWQCPGPPSRPDPPPATPTGAPAGSDEKIAVLQARAARGEPLWHPDDNPRITAMLDQARRQPSAWDQLSRRQWSARIQKYLRLGLSVKEMAAQLGCGEMCIRDALSKLQRRKSP
jgi:hypothetical protein